jgi:glycosyltransferase involved in cell wall biosynthesis
MARGAGDVGLMKILVVAGLAESLINFRGPLLKAFQVKTAEVHVAAPNLAHPSVARLNLEALGFQVHDIPLRRTGVNPVSDIRLIWSLWRLMCSSKPDLVLSYTIKPVIFGTLAAWLAGVPRRFALITGLGYVFVDSSLGLRAAIKWVAQNLYKFSLSKAQTVFFQNPDDQKLFVQMGLLSRNSQGIVVNGSGVDLQHFHLAPLPKGSPHFLLVARLLGDKGLREYVQAARKVRKEYPDTRFTLVGQVDENPDSIGQSELEEWIEERAVDYAGFLIDVRPAIESCGVFVLPSYREGTPRSVLEAMAMGRAIITTDAPGCRETVVNGDNGFLVPVRDAETLAEAMLKFVENPELVALMGQRSRKIAEEKYDVHKVNAVMLREMGVD